MRPLGTLALPVALAAVLATGGCGMLGLFDDAPAKATRSPSATASPSTASPATGPPPGEEAPPVSRISVSDRLKASDRRVIDSAAARALGRGTTGEAVAWRNPETGARGSVTPTSPAYRGHNRRRCRDYQLTVQLGDGGRETLTGTRCRGSGGRWSPVE